MTPRSPTSAEIAAQHRAWSAALYPVALAEIKAGEHDRPRCLSLAREVEQRHHAKLITNIAAQDMVQMGRTSMLNMVRVRAVDPFKLERAA